MKVRPAREAQPIQYSPRSQEKRTRSLKRTELSADKISLRLANKKMRSPVDKAQKKASASRSVPKVENKSSTKPVILIKSKSPAKITPRNQYFVAPARTGKNQANKPSDMMSLRQNFQISSRRDQDCPPWTINPHNQNKNLLEIEMKKATTDRVFVSHEEYYDINEPKGHKSRIIDKNEQKQNEIDDPQYRLQGLSQGPVKPSNDQPSYSFSSSFVEKDDNQNLHFSRMSGIPANQIIETSSPKKQGWRQAIKSLNSINSLQKSSFLQSKPAPLSKDESDSPQKNSLKIQSLRKEERNFRSSKIQSFRKSLRDHSRSIRDESQSNNSSSKGMRSDSFQFMLSRIQTHEFLVELVGDYANQVESYETDPQCQVLAFLLMKKHFLEKSNMIKSLKGGSNNFKLSSLEVKTQLLNKYKDSAQIREQVSKLQRENRQLFKRISSTYIQLRQKYRKSPYLKLQTPRDDFTPEIIRRIEHELAHMRTKLESCQDEEQIQRWQLIIFDTVELVLLLSEMHGLPRRKYEEQVENFQTYWAQNTDLLEETFNYFRNLS